MSGIFGIFNRNGKPVSAETIQSMHDAMAYWGPDGSQTWHDGCAGLGQCLLHNTPEARYEQLPRWLPEQKIAFTAAARIDNRDELCALFNIPAGERPTTPDGDLILQAYLKWGEACPDHLLGDWSFGVWHPEDRRVFLARDHHGNTAIYIFSNGSCFAFASCKAALLALPVVPDDLNEMRLAQILVSWPGDGRQTVHEHIERLPPAHSLRVTPDKLIKHRYWALEDTPLIQRKSTEDYVAEFLDLYTQAVRCCLRSLRPIGTTLSGGLDSSSLTALAARELQEHNRILPAYTSVPLYDVSETVTSNRFGDEFPFASATAQFAGNVEITKITARNVSPITGMKRTLAIHQAPGHAAGNAFWLVDLMQTAQDAGIGTLLTGQGGNATISWTGQRPAERLGMLLHQRAIAKAVKQHLLRPVVPQWAWRRLRIWKDSGKWQLPEQPWLPYSAINPQLAQELHLAEQMKKAGHDPFFMADMKTPLQRRILTISPGKSIVGSKWAENGAGFDMEARDPTVDKRLMTYCLSIPDEIYIDKSGSDRRLIRQAMVGLLPDEVRLNQKRGRQAADVGYHIIRHAGEMDDVLSELRKSHRAATVLDLPRMTTVFQNLQEEVNLQSTRDSGTILLRGIMVGLFLLHS